MSEAMEQHTEKLGLVQKQVRSFFERGQKVKIYHGSTNSTRAQKFEKGKFVDVSNLSSVIEVNTAEQYVLVEPNVPMDKLVEATLRYNFVPPVVMEFPGITVGGGIQGGAGESSSFKYGLFNDTCLEYEIVLGNGDVVIASPTQNEDLFYGTACSYGTLGVITLVKLRLIPSKDFVSLTYHTVNSFKESVDLTGEKIREHVDFVDAVLFEKTRGVVMAGTFSDKDSLPVSTFSRAMDEWFYIHADKISKKFATYKEIIPIREYLFRYDRGAFWMGKYSFDFLRIPFNRFTRFVFNYFCSTRKLYQSLHSANFSQRYLIQDICAPKDSSVKLLEYVAEVLNIFPIWFVPLKPATKTRLSLNYIKTDVVISVGVWADVKQGYSHFVDTNHRLEETIYSLGGRKWLYAHQYYSPEEFWRVYDHEWYDVLRKKFHADSVFPDIYEKTRVIEKYKPSILQAIKKNPFRSQKLPIS